MKKHFVIKNDKLEEVRGYNDDDICIERWEIVYNESDQVVGLRPLSPQEVIPQSILDKIKFWRKPKRLSQILSIDFIGLIQYIGLINKINKIKNIELIDEITTIKNIEHATVDTLTTIRDITWSPRSIFQNPTFEQELAGWYVFGIVQADTSHMHFGKYACKFSDGLLGSIGQHLSICLGVDWFTELYLWLRSSTTGSALEVSYFYSDGSSGTEILSCTVADSWQRKVLSPTAGKHLEYIQFAHLATYTNDVWMDSIAVVF